MAIYRVLDMTLPLTPVRNEKPFLFSRPDEVDITLVHEILGSKPPTNEQVLLKFRLIHHLNQENQKGQQSSSKKDACTAAAKLVESWWKKKVGTDITIKSLSSLSDMVIKLEAEWVKLFKFRWKTTSEQVALREDFKAKLAQTFWAISPVYEAKIANSQDAVSVNNREWLKNMRHPDREGALGPKDKSFTVKMDRKAKKRVSSQTSSFSTAKVDDLDLDEDEECEDLSNSKHTPELDPNFVYPDQPPKMKRDKSILDDPSVSLVADKYKVSHRGLTEIVSAVSKAQGKGLGECTVSVMSTKRRRDQVRTEVGSAVLQKNITSMTGSYTLHWDGKLLKTLTHVGSAEERTAILLVGGTDEILLGIPKIENSTAEAMTTEIIEMLHRREIDVAKIVGLVFDTTAVNSGIHTGVVVRLQRHLKKQLLQLACRHHVSELWGGAACGVVYGRTESPHETCFKTLCRVWSSINTTNYKLPQIKGRFLKDLQEKTRDFLLEFLSGDNSTIRADYKELAELSLLLLGGLLPHGITIHSPGATHHARWMASMIYTFKLTLYRHQLEDYFEESSLNAMEMLAVYLALFYVR